MSKSTVQALSRALKQTIIRGGLEVSAIMESAGMLASARGRAAIFTLHHIRPRRQQLASPNAHLEITPEFLDTALSQLKADGYRFVRLDEMPGLLASGDERQRLAAFTCDDGYRNNVTHGLPVFEKHNAPVTIFISSGFAERTATLWWETAAETLNATSQIRFDFGNGTETVETVTAAQKTAAFNRLANHVWSTPEQGAVSAINALAAQHGVDAFAIVDDLTMTTAELAELSRHPLVSLGAHTTDHLALARLPDEDAKQQIAASIAWLDDRTGIRPTSIAYPYGHAAACGEREYHLARSMGLVAGVTTMPGTIRRPDTQQLYALPRISLNGFYQKARFVRALASGIPFRMMGG